MSIPSFLLGGVVEQGLAKSSTNLSDSEIGGLPTFLQATVLQERGVSKNSHSENSDLKKAAAQLAVMASAALQRKGLGKAAGSEIARPRAGTRVRVIPFGVSGKITNWVEESNAWVCCVTDDGGNTWRLSIDEIAWS
jgi:hypothetical protein